MTPLLLALMAATGVSLLVGGRRRPAVGARAGGPARRFTASDLATAAREWLVQAGLADVRPAELAAVSGALLLVGAAGAYLLVGAPIPALLIGLVTATTPLHLYRSRRAARRLQAQDAWPRLIEEIRIRTLSLGRSVPQALFEVGQRAPAELRPAFEAAQREWLLSVDFGRTLDLLKSQLADPTADAACETLLIAHEVGGTDLAKRLEALAEDRLADSLGRKDARAKQAGVRFARRFVLIVPAGMAAAGSLIGEGRAAYAAPSGQAVVVAAIALVGICWVWAGRYLRFPHDERVFRESPANPVLTFDSGRSPSAAMPVGSSSARAAAESTGRAA